MRQDIKREKKNKRKHRAGSHSRSRAWGITKNLLFYAAIIALLLILFLSLQSENRTAFSKFHFYYIRTGSMEPELPIGSAILTMYVEPTEIEVGDVVTYYNSGGTPITHEVIEVIASGSEAAKDSPEGEATKASPVGEVQPSFKTKGIANDRPDREIVPGENIAGKVIFHIPLLGYVMFWIGSHIILTFVMIILTITLVSLIRKLCQAQDSEG